MVVHSGNQKHKTTQRIPAIINRNRRNKYFKQVIYQKQMIADSFLQGSTVWQMKGAKDATQDYDKLFREILRMDK